MYIQIEDWRFTTNSVLPGKISIYRGVVKIGWPSLILGVFLEDQKLHELCRYFTELSDICSNDFLECIASGMDCLMSMCASYFFSGWNISSDLFLWFPFPSFPRSSLFNKSSLVEYCCKFCLYMRVCLCMYSLPSTGQVIQQVCGSVGSLIFTRVICKFYPLGFQIEIQINVNAW